MTDPLPDAPWITHYDEYRNDACGLRDTDADRVYRRHWEDTLRGETYDEPEDPEDSEEPEDPGSDSGEKPEIPPDPYEEFWDPEEYEEWSSAYEGPQPV